MTLRVVDNTGDDDLARVFIGQTRDGSRIEFVESVQPPITREEKWVLIVSTLKGCPVGCPICDAGGGYKGKLTKDEIIAQIEYLVRRRFPDLSVPVPKLKIQFARMGEPTLNDAVLSVLEELPDRMDVPGLLPSLSTVAPYGCDSFMDALTDIKARHYSGGRFQMQFSIHTTDDEARRNLVPIKTWSLDRIAAWGDGFFEPGDRRVALNFAPTQGYPLSPERVAKLFSPERFMIKLTPINPTFAAIQSGLEGSIDPSDPEGCAAIVGSFEKYGFQTILSIGDLRENDIGSNCGMYVARDRPAIRACQG